MYICELIENHNFSIVYTKGEFQGSYFGADTLNRIIFLCNVKTDDTPTIEYLLRQADHQYRGLYQNNKS